MRFFESEKTVVAYLLVLAACADEPEKAAAPAQATATAVASSVAPNDETKPATEPPAATGGAAKAQPRAAPGPGAPSPSGVRLAIVSGLQGSLTQQQVEQTIGAEREHLRACYGGADARVEVSLQISPSGEVADVGVRRSEPGQPKQKECVEARLGKLRFPSPNASLKLELAIFLGPSD